MTRIDPRVAPRLWSKVDVRNDAECWEWSGRLNQDGYGVIAPFRSRGHQAYAHRAAYELYFGEAPGDLCVCHHCDNPPCCNPHHLFLGTRADNNRDKVAKGRQSALRGEYHGRAILTWDAVEDIRSSPLSRARLAEKYGVAASTIGRVINGTQWQVRDEPNNSRAQAMTGADYE